MIKISQMYIQITVYMNVCMHVRVPVCTCTTTLYACMPINFMYMYIRMYIIQMCGPGITAYKKKHPSLVSVWFLTDRPHCMCMCGLSVTAYREIQTEAPIHGTYHPIGMLHCTVYGVKSRCSTGVLWIYIRFEYGYGYGRFCENVRIQIRAFF